MLKRGVVFLFIVVLLFGVSVTVIAQDNSSDENDDLDDITDEDIDEELGDGGAINRIDRFFDNIFGSEISNMRERFAEIRTLIRRGDIEEAKELLNYYREHAEKLEAEVVPDDRDEAVRLARIIRKAIHQIEKDIPEIDRDEFDFIDDEAKKVEIAAEISHKIKKLCSELHDLGAWDEFENVCKTDNSGPKWQKDFYKDLTEEQRAEAEKFGEIMSSCMRTSGRECDCGAIPHEGMSKMCFQAAPLARECDEGKEESCDELDDLDFPDDLPEYLLEVMDRIEERFGDDAYDNHIPRECAEAGITGEEDGDRQACMRIMITESREIPEECRSALREAFDSGETRESHLRKVCERIMFEQHRPEECADIDDPEECAELFENEFRGDFDSRGPDCRSIENSEDRLECYDNIENRYEDRFEHRQEFDGERNYFPEECREANALDRESCENVMRSLSREMFEETQERQLECAQKCESKGAAWDFSGGDCRCFVSDFDYEYKDDSRYDDYDYGDEYRDKYTGDYEYSDEYTDDTLYYEDDSSSGSSDSNTYTDESKTFDYVESSNGVSESDSITGNVIYDEDFLDYYFK